MFSFIESLRQALTSIRAHALRSFLTTLGIIIGVAAVIAVVSLVQGMSASISEDFKGLGTNSLSVHSDTPFEQAIQGRRNRLSLNDYQQIVRHVDGIHKASPSFNPFVARASSIKSGQTQTYSSILAVTPSYSDVSQVYPALGRYLSESDLASRRKVCVIGDKTRENLKLPVDPIGRYIEIDGDWYKIVGLAEQRGEMFGMSQDDFILIPFTVGEAIAGNSQVDVFITFTVNKIEQIEEIQDRVKSLLRNLHHLKPGEPDDFKVQTAQQLMSQFKKVIDTLTLVLGGIVSVSLLVGGIGIMNIMLVSVTERTREIGICKALGAQRHHILLQFLIEATLLSLLGGVIGLGLGYGLGAFAAAMIPHFPPASVPWWAVILAFGFSAGVGIIFGIMPAAKAASLDPIEALRYE